jgi:hypothetical protein
VRDRNQLDLVQAPRIFGTARPSDARSHRGGAAHVAAVTRQSSGTPSTPMAELGRCATSRLRHRRRFPSVDAGQVRRRLASFTFGGVAKGCCEASRAQACGESGNAGWPGARLEELQIIVDHARMVPVRISPVCFGKVHIFALQLWEIDRRTFKRMHLRGPAGGKQEIRQGVDLKFAHGAPCDEGRLDGVTFLGAREVGKCPRFEDRDDCCLASERDRKWQEDRETPCQSRRPTRSSSPQLACPPSPREEPQIVAMGLRSLCSVCPRLHLRIHPSVDF